MKESVPAIGPGSLATPLGLAYNPNGFLLAADTDAQRVRQITANGIANTLAGNGQGNFSGDGGPAFNAGLNSPRCVIFDGAGGYYVCDSANHRVRHVMADGNIVTVAGTGVQTFRATADPGIRLQSTRPEGWCKTVRATS